MSSWPSAASPSITSPSIGGSSASLRSSTPPSERRGSLPPPQASRVWAERMICMPPVTPLSRPGHRAKSVASHQAAASPTCQGTTPSTGCGPDRSLRRSRASALRRLGVATQAVPRHSPVTAALVVGFGFGVGPLAIAVGTTGVPDRMAPSVRGQTALAQPAEVTSDAPGHAFQAAVDNVRRPGGTGRRCSSPPATRTAQFGFSQSGDARSGWPACSVW